MCFCCMSLDEKLLPTAQHYQIVSAYECMQAAISGARLDSVMMFSRIAVTFQFLSLFDQGKAP